MTPYTADEELLDLERLVTSSSEDPGQVRRLAVALERAGRLDRAWLVLCAGGQDDPRLGAQLFARQAELFRALGAYDQGTNKLWGSSYENPPWTRSIPELRAQARPILGLKAQLAGSTEGAPSSFLRAPSLLALRLEGFPPASLEIPPDSGLRWLELWLPELLDRDLEDLARLSALEVLRFGPSQICGAGLAWLRPCTRLRALSLANSSLRDQHLSHLTGFPKLQRLDLYETQLTNAGLRQLCTLTELTELELGGTWITDSGLPALAELPKLRALSLRATRTSRLGRKKLEALLPKCRILA